MDAEDIFRSSVGCEIMLMIKARIRLIFSRYNILAKMYSFFSQYVVVNIYTMHNKGSLTVWALYAYFSDSQNAAFELLVWCM